MGGVVITLKNLFDNYKEFEEIINVENGDEIDLSGLKFYPVAVLPLLCECKNKNLRVCGDGNAFEYLEDILKEDILFSELPKSRKESDDVDFLTKYMDNLDDSYGGYFSLRTVISELLNNVYDHSRMENDDVQSYILSNHYPNHNKLDVCVIDDGLSIPRLFEKSGVTFSNDCQAIEKAIGIFSTISDDAYERGNGLWTVIRLIAEGNNGELLIISRCGCLHICGENYKYYLLNEKHMFKGTLVCARLNQYEIQNIYDLIEFNKPDSYKLVELYDY